MIEFLNGKVFKKFPPNVILDVNGVGYGVEMPSSNFAALPSEGSPLSLWIYTRVKEDVFKLYGFLSLEDRKVFGILLNINGIGPKAALGILSTVPVRYLKAAVERRETAILESVPGIGKRTAEKVLIELQNKLDKLGFENQANDDFLPQGRSLIDTVPRLIEEDFGTKKLEDLSSALENLGFKKKDLVAPLEKIIRNHQDESLQDLIRRALAVLKPMDKKKNSRDLDQIF